MNPNRKDVKISFVIKGETERYYADSVLMYVKKKYKRGVIHNLEIER